MNEEKFSVLQSHLAKYDQLLQEQEQLAKDFSENVCKDPAEFTTLEKNLKKIVELGVSDEVSIDEIASTWNYFRGLKSKFEKIKDIISGLENTVSGEPT